MKGLLVFADGRAHGYAECSGAPWWIRRLADGDHFFKAVDVARVGETPEEGILVYVERPELEYRVRLTVTLTDERPGTEIQTTEAPPS